MMRFTYTHTHSSLLRRFQRQDVRIRKYWVLPKKELLMVIIFSKFLLVTQNKFKSWDAEFKMQENKGHIPFNLKQIIFKPCGKRAVDEDWILKLD
jgi:hypothetical protein